RAVARMMAGRRKDGGAIYFFLAAGAAALAAGAAPLAAGAAPFAPAAGAAVAPAAGVAVAAPSAASSWAGLPTSSLRCPTLGRPKTLLDSFHFSSSLSC